MDDDTQDKIKRLIEQKRIERKDIEARQKLLIDAATPEKIYDRIKAFADEQGKSLRQVATFARLSPSAIAQYKRGVEPTYLSLLKIAGALNTDYGKLISDDPVFQSLMRISGVYKKIFIKGIGGISFDELIDYFKSGKLPEDSVAAIANELEVSTQYLRTGTIINEHDEKVEKLIELSYKRAMTPKYDEIDMLAGVDVQRKIVNVPAEFSVTSWVNKIPDIGDKTRRRIAKYVKAQIMLDELDREDKAENKEREMRKKD